MQTLYFNPANASFVLDHETKGRVAIKYRDQWNNISSPTFRTTLLEGEYKIYKSSLDSWHVGALLLNDQSNEGLLKQNSASLVTSYTRKFGSFRSNYHQISLGTSVGFTKTNANTQELWFSRQYDQATFTIDPNLSSGETGLLDNRFHASVDIGLRWLFQIDKKTTIQAGIAMHHLNSPRSGLIDINAVINQKNLFTLAATRQTGKSTIHRIGVNVLRQDPSVQVVPSYDLKLDFLEEENITVELGVSSRITKSINGFLNDAVIITVGLQTSKWLTRFSYEANTSGLTYVTKSTGALELALEYYLSPNY